MIVTCFIFQKSVQVVENFQSSPRLQLKQVQVRICLVAVIISNFNTNEDWYRDLLIVLPMREPSIESFRFEDEDENEYEI